MKLTIQLKLLPDTRESAVLLTTMARFNEAATFAARVGFDAGVYSQPSIHGRCYRKIRERFGLTAQMAVRAIGKAVETFKTLKAKGKSKEVCPTFKARGAVTYDQRILSFKGLDRVSIWTMEGRMILPLAYGEYQGERFNRIKGQCDLVYRKGKFFLYATVDLPDGSPIEPTAFLGVDLGIVQLATDSDGNSHSGEAVEKVRKRHQRNRNGLQRKGTKGAKKRLRSLSGKEARFRLNENHRISKTIVALAKDTARGIGLENMTGIRERVTVGRKQRAKHSGWAFAQLQGFVAYKAQQVGIPIIKVDARNTSRQCSICGHIDKANRKTQSEFRCLHCGHSENADLNAARNIGFRAWDSFRQSSKLTSMTSA
jgi:putative transposase